jgi:DNA-binding beta-propeller fold protein YncE
MAWKEAFAAKDTGGFYGKLAAAIIGTAAAVINTGVALATINRYETGTGSSAGGLAMVGEAGPEMVRLPAGSTVYNAAETRNYVSNNNAQTVIHVTSGGVTETFKAAIRSGGADRLISDMFARAKSMRLVPA